MTKNEAEDSLNPFGPVEILGVLYFFEATQPKLQFEKKTQKPP